MTATFTAPTSYADAQTYLGKSFLFEDGQERECNSAGFSGNFFFVGFKDESLWTYQNGFETKAQKKRRVWGEQWASLKANERRLVLAAFPGVEQREDRENLKKGGDLVVAAKARLLKEGRIELRACTRCHGSGEYSYCEMYGRKCFQCHGKGKMFPTTSDILKTIRCE